MHIRAEPRQDRVKRWLVTGLSLGFVAGAVLVAYFWFRGAPTQDQSGKIRLPSGLIVELQEMLWDRPGGGLVYRFRFFSSAFTGNEDFDEQTQDLAYLCNEYALPKLADIGPQPSRIVISLADRATAFGEFQPDVMQVFESFSLQNETCMLEIF
ncbi:MAG: DUF6497 family protein [Pseudomonadota bacterium]